MAIDAPDMVDVAFAIEGERLPEGYAFWLWDAVVRILPWLDAEDFAGILPLRGSADGQGLLLARRARLVLRLPAGLAGQAGALCGRVLGIGDSVLKVGAATARPLLPFATLHAHLVEGDGAESVFIDGVSARLGELGVVCKWICGRHQVMAGAGRTLGGYSLVLHDLKPDDSLRLQRAGLGGNRRFGCGIFLPYKDISGLD